MLLFNENADSSKPSSARCRIDKKAGPDGRIDAALLRRKQGLYCRPQRNQHQNYTIPMYEIGGVESSIPRVFADGGAYGQEPDYTYSRFSDAFPLDSTNALHFAVMCDRKNSELPLKGLINSLLKLSSRPVAIHLVKSHRRMDWLDQLDSPFFQINFYHYERLGLLGDAIRMAKKYQFKSNHRSDPYPMVKPFISILPFPNRFIRRVMIIDDDFTFQDDPAALFDAVDPRRLAMACPADPERVHKWYADRKNDGHPYKYCNSGMVHMPVLERRFSEDFGWTNDILDMYMVAMRNMERDYPKTMHWLSDQDVMNRVFAENEAIMGDIPCEWHCHFTGCKERSDNEAGTCQNCPSIGRANERGEVGRCRAFHFLAHAYEKHVAFANPENEFDFLFHQSSLQLLYNVFWPRFVNASTPVCTPAAAG